MQRHLILLLITLTAVILPAGAAEPVTFQTQDAIVIAGLYQPPREPGRPVVILLHGLGSTKSEWTTFERRLEAAGYGYFAYDARGHGESTKTTAAGTISYARFGPPGPGSPWHAMIGDLDHAARFLSRAKTIKESSLIIAGASLGANIGLAWAADHPTVAAVLLLSPGLEYAGIASTGPAARFSKRRIAFAAAPNDAYAYQSSRMLFKNLSSNPRAAFFTGTSGHGVQMFNGSLEDEILQWLNK